MTTITKEKLNLFVLCAKHYLIDRSPSELSKAVEALLEPATKRLKKVERERELIRIKLCKKTSTKHIEYDKGGRYQFTEADNITLLEKMDEIDAQTVDMPSEIVENFPDDGLTYDIRLAFEGIVIPKISRKFDEEPIESAPSE